MDIAFFTSVISAVILSILIAGYTNARSDQDAMNANEAAQMYLPFGPVARTAIRDNDWPPTVAQALSSVSGGRVVRRVSHTKADTRFSHCFPELPERS